MIIEGLEDSNEASDDLDEDSWLIATATLTKDSTATVHVSLSFTLGEAAQLGVWLRTVGESAAFGSAPPALYWTIEPGFAVEARDVGDREALMRFYVYCPAGSRSQHLTPVVNFPAAHLDVRARPEQMEAWADEWGSKLPRY